MNTQVAVITGASAGIGRGIAEYFAQQNIHVALLARRQEKLTEIATHLQDEYGVTAKTYQCDVTQQTDVENAFAQIAEDFEYISILVNNAGISSRASAETLTPEPLQRDFEVNVLGAYMCSVLASQRMPNGGAIVNMSSIRARTGTPSGSIGYAAAKAAVINLTKTLAIQLAPLNIRVNCITPGAIYPTEMSVNWPEAVKERIIDDCLIKRLGTPEDIAKAAYFLGTDLSSYITGHTLDVNGGVWMST